MNICIFGIFLFQVIRIPKIWNMCQQNNQYSWKSNTRTPNCSKTARNNCCFSNDCSITHICCFLQNSAWYLMSSCQMHLIVQHICSSSPCPISINLELRGRGSFWGCNYNHASYFTATCLCWTVRSTCVRGKKTSNSGVTRCWMMFIYLWVTLASNNNDNNNIHFRCWIVWTTLSECYPKDGW